jgi:hypothetical protein
LNASDKVLVTNLLAIPGVSTKTRVGQKFYYYSSDRVTHITSLIMRQKPCVKRAYWPKRKVSMMMDQKNNIAPNVLQPTKSLIYTYPPPPLGTLPKQFNSSVVNSKPDCDKTSTNWKTNPLAEVEQIDEVITLSCSFQKHCSFTV